MKSNRLAPFSGPKPKGVIPLEKGNVCLWKLDTCKLVYKRAKSVDRRSKTSLVDEK